MRDIRASLLFLKMTNKLKDQQHTAPQANIREKEGDQSADTDGSDGRHDIVKTETNTSIAETLSLPREILFVAVICLAQLFTRTYRTHVYS